MVTLLSNGSYKVASHTGNGTYTVSLVPPSCTCPHFQKRLASTWGNGKEGKICKHIEDVLIWEGAMQEKERKSSKKGPWLSKGGYPMDEVTSALQKSIRRGQEFEAGYWALELIDSGHWKYLMDRLQTIACEDIGLANPMAVLTVSAVRQGIETKLADAAKKGKVWMGAPKEQIGFLILYLCRSCKSRQADDYIWYVQRKRKEGTRLDIPEYAIDKHTTRGREIIRQIAKEKKITIGKAGEEEFYLKGGCLHKFIDVSGIDWSKILFEEMALPYTRYELKEEEIEPPDIS
jgi:hypothetical protein